MQFAKQKERKNEKMLRGVFVKVPQSFETAVLSVTLKPITVEQYKWYNLLSQNEVWTNQDGENAFNSPFYNGKDFLQQIQKKHFIVFIKLQAYDQDGAYCDITTYHDFLQSDCQILILINDCEFLEIFMKDEALIKDVYQNALSSGYHATYITDDNDGRTKMNVL